MKYNRDLARDNKELAILNKRTIQSINKNSSQFGSVTRLQPEIQKFNRLYPPNMEEIKSQTLERVENKRKQKQ